MSASLKPRLVTAGVPTRTPLVTNGERVSFGTVFLFTVMFASSSSVLQQLARHLRAGQVKQQQMVVRAVRTPIVDAFHP